MSNRLPFIAALVVIVLIVLAAWSFIRNRPDINISAAVLIEPKQPVSKLLNTKSVLADGNEIRAEAFEIPITDFTLSNLKLGADEFLHEVLEHPDVRNTAIIKGADDPLKWLRDRLEIVEDRYEPNILYLELSGYRQIESPDEMLAIMDAVLEVIKRRAGSDFAFELIIKPSL